MNLNLAPWQAAALFSPFTHTAMLCGVAVGKTFTGAQFAIMMMRKYPDLTGFIGANTYDQLTMATLAELFHWLEEYNIPFVIDRKPPKEWRPRTFKKYNNILSCLINGKCVHVFVRVLSKGNPLRGTEFSWYYIDETRDTPLNTHDVILSRLRESKTIKGLVTTTTNAEDWVHNRFVKGNNGSGLYGTVRAKTYDSVRCGIITEEYYNSLRASYSPLFAMQELDALHVNTKGGRAYYAADRTNARLVSPWGDSVPNPSRELIIGADFNYQPAPCIWMIGQRGPDIVGPDGINYSDCIHWFDEMCEDTEPNSYTMTKSLVGKYPGFFYQVFGDASGTRGSTSNMGVSDYRHMTNAFNDCSVLYSIDVDQANPRVKDRVETMNATLRNGLGQTRQTYNPVNCKEFHSDLNVVGWKPMVGTVKLGRLDDAGDCRRTHATDGAGYAVFKLFPVGERARLISGIASNVSRSNIARR